MVRKKTGSSFPVLDNSTKPASSQITLTLPVTSEAVCLYCGCSEFMDINKPGLAGWSHNKLDPYTDCAVDLQINRKHKYHTVWTKTPTRAIDGEGNSRISGD